LKKRSISEKEIYREFGFLKFSSSPDIKAIRDVHKVGTCS
jgi:hypothetical protein